MSISNSSKILLTLTLLLAILRRRKEQPNHYLIFFSSACDKILTNCKRLSTNFHRNSSCSPGILSNNCCPIASICVCVVNICSKYRCDGQSK
uniref:VWFA domain-containing protein n=1 Tax=Parascaris univalens TaxID=6257 RepID=A0A915CK38_PARUN